MSDPIFSRSRRRLARSSALVAPADSQWLLDRMTDELIDRLDFISIDARSALVIGHGAKALRAKFPHETQILSCDLAAGPGVDIIAEEDRLPIADGSQDLIMACGTLDNIDDLPGALILMRRALKPGGLFLGALLGAGSLSQLRARTLKAETELTGQMALRFHPQIDVRSAGDLLFRAGFSTPVADQENVSVTYSDLRRLRADVKAAGASNVLSMIQPMPRAVAKALRASMADAPFQEEFAPIYMTGWAPVAGEQRPSGPSKGLF